MRWKYFLLAAGLLFCVLSTTVGFSSDEKTGEAAVAKGEPVAVVAEDNFSFAMVVDGSQVVHDFVLKNEGTAPLAVEKVKTG